MTGERRSLRRWRCTAGAALQGPAPGPLRIQRRQDGRGEGVLHGPARLQALRRPRLRQDAVGPEGRGPRRHARLLHALRDGPPRVRALQQAGARPPPRPEVPARRHRQPDHLAVRQPPGDHGRPHLLPGPRRPHPARGARHAGEQLARVRLRPRRPHQRALLRHRADRLEPAEQARRDVLPGLPRKAGSAPDLGDGRGGRGARQGHRRLLRPPHARDAFRDLRRGGRAAARGRSRSPRSVR